MSESINKKCKLTKVLMKLIGADVVKLECHYNEGCSLLKSVNL